MRKAGTAEFHTTGLCIDLIRIVPEVTCLAVIHDPAFYEKYRDQIEAAENDGEHDTLTHMVTVPRGLKNFENWVQKEVVRDPEGMIDGRGFDAGFWTLPGGFCFYQGLRSAAYQKLLH